MHLIQTDVTNCYQLNIVDNSLHNVFCLKTDCTHNVCLTLAAAILKVRSTTIRKHVILGYFLQRSEWNMIFGQVVSNNDATIIIINITEFLK